MRVEISMVGTSPMLCHNIRLADPLDEIVKEIKKITKKRTKTEEDHKELGRLEFFGGLYMIPAEVDGEGPCVPTKNMWKCIVEAAKITRQGKQVTRALIFEDMYAPIAYEGPSDPQKLWDAGDFIHRVAVGNKNNRVMRTRPKFSRWAVASNAHLLTDLLDLEELTRIVELAGVIEGLGDNRTHGYGRFNGLVSAA